MFSDFWNACPRYEQFSQLQHSTNHEIKTKKGKKNVILGYQEFS